MNLEDLRFQKDYKLFEWEDNKYQIFNQNSYKYRFVDQELFNLLRLSYPNTHEKMECNYIKYKFRFVEKVHFEMTNRCNYNCRHCFMSAKKDCIQTLTYQDCLRIIDQIDGCGIRKINLSGGEPFFREDILNIMDYIAKKKIIITHIYTNGSLINTDILSFIKSKGVHPTFIISFDGVGHHDWMRGVNGAEKKTLETIQLLVNEGFEVYVSMCLHKKNANSVIDTIKLLDRLGVSHIIVSKTGDFGRWNNQLQDYKLSVSERGYLVLEYVQDILKLNLNMAISLLGLFEKTRDGNMYVPIENNSPINVEKDKICNCGQSVIAINHQGYVFPCEGVSMLGVDATKYPSVLNEDLINILQKDTFKTNFKSKTLKDLFNEKEKCKNCNFKYVCRGAGCSLAHFSVDNRMADDDVCIFFNQGYVNKIKEMLKI